MPQMGIEYQLGQKKAKDHHTKMVSWELILSLVGIPCCRACRGHKDGQNEVTGLLNGGISFPISGLETMEGVETFNGQKAEGS